MMMEAIDLFCGAGGSTLGAKLAGHRVTHAYDIDSTSLDAYQENHPEVEVHQTDILDLDANQLPKGAEIFLGSTPCESFSLLNLHDRSCDMQLTRHFLNVVKDYKPAIWVMENVPQIARFLNGTPYRLLCAANYGVPQRRVRCMVGNYTEPGQTHAEHPCGHLRPWVTFGKIRDDNKDNWSVISMKGLSGAYKRAWEMGKKGNSFHLQFIDESGVLPTVTSSESHGVRCGSTIVYEGGMLRRLTFLECVRAQSFPDDYVFKGTVQQKYKQVGQAVPPLLMKAILRSAGDGT